MSKSWRFRAVFWALLGLGITACTDPEEGTGIVKPKASPTPTSAPASGGLKGGVSGEGSSDPVVQYVQLDASTLSLNVPTAAGILSGDLASSASLKARAVLSTGQDDAAGVDWQVADPSRLSVEATTGIVSIKAGAATGVTSLTAVSKRNPALKASMAVTITRDGVLWFKGLTSGGSGYVRANITRNGYFFANQPLVETDRLRLPEGSPYEVQLQQVSGGDTSVVGDFSNLTILPNGTTVATMSL